MYKDTCVLCPSNTYVNGGTCDECFTGVMLEVDRESRFWKENMWSSESQIEYFPQWTNPKGLENRGIMRYNNYDAVFHRYGYIYQ